MPANAPREALRNEKNVPAKVSEPAAVRLDPCDQRDQEETRNAAKRAMFQPPPTGPKLSKAFLWELKVNMNDLSRKLKPVIKKKNERKVIDPDKPYVEELREVQAEVLPVWRRETYSYWI
jgi:hypothetical protein